MENSVSIVYIPIILDQIFVHLPIASLNKCARVCKLWNSMVQYAKRKRRDVFWICKVQDHEAHRRGPATNWRRCPVCRTTRLQLVSHFHEVLQAAPSMPKSGIMFICDDMAKASREYSTYLLEPVTQCLPPDFTMTLCFSNGIIGTSADCSQVQESHAFGFSSVIFPAIPGMETFEFTLTGSADTIDTFCNEDYISSLTGIPKDKEVKCLLLFKDPENKTFEPIVKHYIQKQNSLVVGGGRIESLILYPKSKKLQIGVTFGLAFAGEGTEAASVLLGADETPEQVFEKLHHVKTNRKFSDNCVAFMFYDGLCSATAKVKAETFHKVFPKVPLFGGAFHSIFGNTSYSSVNPEFNIEWHYNAAIIILSLSQV